MLLSPEGLWLLLGKVWMGSHHAPARGSHHETVPPSSIRGASWQPGEAGGEGLVLGVSPSPALPS